jgi:hypothetical protein
MGDGSLNTHSSIEVDYWQALLLNSCRSSPRVGAIEEFSTRPSRATKKVVAEANIETVLAGGAEPLGDLRISN